MRPLFLVPILCMSIGCSSSSLRRFEPSNLLSLQRPADYLTTKYERLVIEVVPAVGVQVVGVDALVTSARRLCRKPLGVEAVVRDPVQLPSKVWTKADLLDLREKVTSVRTKANTVVLHVLAVPGGFVEEPETTSGVVFTADLICLFPERPLGNRLTDRVLLHEWGHVLGLVDGGTPALSRHEEDGHCTEPSCLMYWAIHAGTGDLDPACLRDLGRE